MIPNQKPNYLTSILVTLSQASNVIFFNGWPDEMFSARCYREREDNVYLFGMINLNIKYSLCEKILNKIFFWQEEHCYSTYLWELYRTDLGNNYDNNK